MSNIDLLSLWSGDLTSGATKLAKKSDDIVISGLANETGRSLCVVNLLKQNLGKSVLLLVNDKKQRRLMTDSLLAFGSAKVEEFILEEVVQKDVFVERKNLISMLNLAAKLSRDNFGVVVANFEDVLGTVARKKDVYKNIATFAVGQNVVMVDLFRSLIDMNYHNGQSVYVEQGEYYCMGDQLTVFPVNFDYPVRLTVAFDQIEKIEILSLDQGAVLSEIDEFDVWPILDADVSGCLSEYAISDIFIVENELDLLDENFKLVDKFLSETDARKIRMSTFNADEENHTHLMFSSTLRYASMYDFISGFKF